MKLNRGLTFHSRKRSIDEEAEGSDDEDEIIENWYEPRIYSIQNYIIVCAKNIGTFSIVNSQIIHKCV